MYFAKKNSYHNDEISFILRSSSMMVFFDELSVIKYLGNCNNIRLQNAKRARKHDSHSLSILPRKKLVFCTGSSCLLVITTSNHISVSLFWL